MSKHSGWQWTVDRELAGAGDRWDLAFFGTSTIRQLLRPFLSNERAAR
jgi:hypothetical protein